MRTTFYVPLTLAGSRHKLMQAWFLTRCLRVNQYSVPPEYIGKRLSLQVHDHMIHVYYNMKLVTLHEVSSKKLNYHDSHYLAISKLTIPLEETDMYQFAKENLKRIGAIYEND